MFNIDIDDPIIKKLVVEVPQGESLFKQGDRGNTLFILAGGTVALYQKTLERVRLVDFIGPGEILGEKALFQVDTYNRSLTAKARTEVLAIEFTAASLKGLINKLPNFSNQVLRLVTERLDRTNRLVGILQLRHDHEKIVQYLIHFSKTFGTRVQKGTEILLSQSELSDVLNMEKGTVENALQPLIDKKLILQNGDKLILSDERDLVSFLPHLAELIAA